MGRLTTASHLDDHTVEYCNIIINIIDSDHNIHALLTRTCSMVRVASFGQIL